MHRFLPGLLALILCLVFPIQPHCLELNSISPTRASSGERITVTGGPFGQETLVILGDRVLSPTILDSNRLHFTLPPIPPGNYNLLLQSGPKRSDNSYQLQVTEPTPTIRSISPANLDQCAMQTVQIEAQNLLPGATMLLNGSGFPYRQTGLNTLTFTPPPLEAGVYGIELVNPGGKKSLPQSLYINDIPEILNVRAGQYFVTSYQIYIEGKNFFYNSTLLINEHKVGFLDELPPVQKVIPAQGGISASTDSGTPIGQRQVDNLQYINCKTLIYNRFPFSTQPKKLTLQVINPDGKESSVYSVNLP